ncbi:MAG: DUF998 domain-containing protein [Bowdeniella nasicola]|nr:DUF998 domain-containing protein [Bowdeniella nasicola]
MTRRNVTLVLVLSGLCYLTPLWEAVAGYPLNPQISFVSELAARDQQWGWIFQLTDLVAALLLGLGVSMIWRGRCGFTAIQTLFSVALGVAAVGTIADVLFPMVCAESLPRCAAAYHAGDLPVSHSIHIVTSSIAVAGMTVAAAACLLQLRISRHRPVMVVAALAASGVIATLVGQGLLFATGAPLGWMQRIHVIASAALIATSPIVLQERRQS